MKAGHLLLSLMVVVASFAGIQALRSRPEPGAIRISPGRLALPVPAAPSAVARKDESRPPAHETVVARQAPVPLVLPTRVSTYTVKDTHTETASGDTETVSGDAALPGLTEVGARTAIEADGYKNVRVVSMASDGTWRARALRGQTEVTLRVDAAGYVSSD